MIKQRHKKSPILSQQYRTPPKEAFSHGYSGEQGAADQQQSALARDARVVDFQTHTFTSRQFTITEESQVIADYNPARRYLFIQNKEGGAQAQLAFGTLAVSQVGGGFNSVDLPAGTSIEYAIVCPNNEITAVCLPTTVVTVVEGIVDGFDFGENER